MSYGFGVGDFIAVGELSWKLYRSVYQVARDAPPEIKSLHQELSNLSNIVKALHEDCLQEDSFLAQAPEERVELGRGLLKATEDNLRGLAELVDKYLPLGQPRVDPKSRREAIRRLWAKVKYTGVVRDINDYRAKIHYNTGTLNLLLVAAGNSSLERIQQQNEKLSRNVEDIKAAIQNPSHAQKSPIVTCSYDEDSQYKLSRAFVEKAEVKGVPWAAIGIESWIQVGKWWLMKAQAGLDGSVQGQCQAYADLLKASWILTDVISIHPQLSFLSSGQQQLDIEQISRVVRLEHERLATSGFTRPSVDSVMASDLTVWEKDLKTSLLPPIGRDQGRGLAMWKSDSGNVLFQRFGRCILPSAGTETECVVLLVDEPGKPLTVIGQSAYGIDIVLAKPTYANMADETDSGWQSLTLTDWDTKHTFRFLNRKDVGLFILLIRGINKFRSRYGILGHAVPEHDVRTLRAIALLHWISEQHDDDIRLLTNLEETDNEVSHDHSDLWNIAFVLSQQPTPLAAQYLSHVENEYLEGYPMRAGVLSWILWANIPASTRLATLDTFLPNWRTEHLGEVHQATTMSQDLQLMQAVVRCTILPPGDTSLEGMDSTESILLRYASRFLEHTDSIVLLWASLIMRSPKLTTFVMQSGLKKTIHKRFRTICAPIIFTKDTAACEFFLRYVGPFLGQDRIGDLWCFAQIICCSSGIKCIALESADWDESDAQQLLIPAIIGGNVEFIEALQLHIGFFSVHERRFDYFINETHESCWDNGYVAGWGLVKSSTGWLGDEWPCLPLLMAIRLARPIELISHLIWSGALLWKDARIKERKPSILELVRSYQTLNHAREKFDGSHTQLGLILYKNLYSGLKNEWAAEAAHDLAKIMLQPSATGLCRMSEATGPRKYFTDLPVSLQTEANFVEWKERLIALLEEATVSQLYCPVSNPDSPLARYDWSSSCEDSSIANSESDGPIITEGVMDWLDDQLGQSKHQYIE